MDQLTIKNLARTTSRLSVLAKKQQKHKSSLEFVGRIYICKII